MCLMFIAIACIIVFLNEINGDGEVSSKANPTSTVGKSVSGVSAYLAHTELICD